MKQNCILIITFLLMLNIGAQEGLSEAKELGLMAYLTTLKTFAEQKVINSEVEFTSRNSERKAPDTTDVEVRNRIRDRYLMLKWRSDMFINQFTADLVDRNAIGLYRRVNENLQDLNGNRRSKRYARLVGTMEAGYRDLSRIEYPRDMDKASLDTFKSLLDIVGLTPYGIYKDIKATKEKKIAALVDYMRELRLSPYAGLVKPAFEEED